MSRRDQIQMTQDEVLAFLAEEKTVICATVGKDGWPHLMPLWYVVRDGTVWAWTFGKSQKVKNLQRDPKATIQVEAGTEYQALRGVMMKTEVRVHTDLETVLGVGLEVMSRYGGGALESIGEDVRAMVSKQAEKRVAFEFVETERATWDHRKLEAGVY
ncbi:MAG: pyridoxamine 5-phosphate oxidase [Solirubrobacterales bacterium]|nr:pyridoxamine 5-phosphate oxidase [Solirubrobacterales bacterium]